MRTSVWLWNACLFLAALVLIVVPAQAAPPAQDPVGEGSSDPASRTGVAGTVVNWGYRNEPDLQLSLAGSGWAVETVSTSEGRFLFNNLGEGVAVLNPVLPEESDLRAMTTDLAVPLFAPDIRTVNLGVYGSTQFPSGLPLAVEIVPSDKTVGWGETVSFTVTITNHMPNDISQVFVTDLLPDSLTPTAIESSTGNAWIGGQLAAADIGSIAKGDAAIVEIVAMADPNLDRDEMVTNRVGVLYHESVALQAEVTLNDEPMMPQTLPETGTRVAMPVGVAVVLFGAIICLRHLRLNPRR